MFQMAPNRQYPHLYTPLDFHLDLDLDQYQRVLTIQTNRTQTLLSFDQSVTLLPQFGSIAVCFDDPLHPSSMHWVVLRQAIVIQPGVSFNCLSADDQAELILATSKPSQPTSHRTRRQITLPELESRLKVESLVSMTYEDLPQDYKTRYLNGDYFDLIISFKGDLHLEYSDQSYHLRAGDALLLPPRTDYQLHTNARTNKLLSIWFTASDMTEARTDHQIQIPDVLLKQMKNLEFDAEALTQPYYLDYLINHLTSLLLYMQSPNLTSYTQTSLPAQESYENDLIQEMTTFLKEHITEYHEVNDLVELFDLSRTRIQTLFNDHLGMSPIQYINHLRLEKSTELLLKEDLSIQEVASTLGFGSPQYFSRVFKAEYGLTPTQYIQKENFNQ